MYKIINLSYRYNKSEYALKDINMDLDNGDIVGLVGSNGSGKSTLFMNMMGIFKPTQGHIIFDGKELEYKKKSLYNLRRNVGLVFQDPEKQIFHSKVYDDIAFSLRNIRMDEETIKKVVFESLKQVKCIDLAEKPVHMLSYGQKKKIAIASVIAMDNKIVLFDEPTAGLDPASSKAVKNIITNIKKRGIKVLIASHDMDLIYTLSDYIYILKKGHVIKQGETLQIFENEEDIVNAELELPWLVKVHKYMNYPLFKTEGELFEYNKKKTTIKKCDCDSN